MKPWWHSKVLWLNVVAAMLSAIEVATGAAQATLGASAPAVWATFAIVLSALNAALRVITSQALTFRRPEGP